MAKKKVSKKKVAKKPELKVLRAFKFTGDPIGGDDPAGIRMYGRLFELNGAAVSVTDEVAELLDKHTHFTEV